jgi:hypothetical protein
MPAENYPNELNERRARESLDHYLYTGVVKVKYGGAGILLTANGVTVELPLPPAKGAEPT